MIDFKPPKQEYWQNIYCYGSLLFYGFRFSSREACEPENSYSLKPSYRIHVKLK